MKPTVYIETTFISYLTAWPSRDVIRAGQQLVTKAWWQSQAGRFELVTSELVLIEAGAGDPIAAAARLAELTEIPILEVRPEIREVSELLLSTGAIPSVAASDALHIAIAACHGIDYLLTWNFRHLANASMRGKIETACEDRGYRCPVICTPDELME